ncbi:putative signal transducing protein [Ulvibacter sp. MAR_2010_11]|uniref:putative signal transducing protein n=1 Tax=Ulvibacter sp. MAR_2010_11 TaxID=1250229 RepID=UPI000C2BEF11|nr:DUF2007 domain-containing protein [Ulvibacter sp. MAR_2010_11]PKA82947.1 putative signal transducing protein [Ulvibacter sp. MAR_2010_11]
MENFKTIAIFTYQSEYAVLRLLLEQAEIRHVFLNETMLSVLPFHSNAFGGIRLQVHQNDIEAAKKIIQELDGTSNMRIV